MLFHLKVDPIDIRIHLPAHTEPELKAMLMQIANSVSSVKEIVMATSADVVKRLNDLGVEIGKIGTETETLLQTIADLRAAVEAGGITPEVEAALAAVEAQAKVVDDKVPDVPPVA